MLQTELSEMIHAARFGPVHRDFNLCTEYQDEYRALGLPDLLSGSFGDSDRTAEVARTLDDRIRRWFAERQQSLAEYPSIEELKRALQHA